MLQARTFMWLSYQSMQIQHVILHNSDNLGNTHLYLNVAFTSKTSCDQISKLSLLLFILVV